MIKTDLVILSALLLSTELLGQDFKDPRDGQSYPIITVAGMTWFAKNLNYETEGSYCYEDKISNCDEFGRLYTWESAMGACPPGWHLATEYEWQYIETALGMELRELMYRGNRGVDEGAKLKKGGSSGMDLLFAGWRQNNIYEAKMIAGALWTATEADLDHAWHRDVDMGDEFLFRSRVDKTFALSCRCVQNRSESN